MTTSATECEFPNLHVSNFFTPFVDGMFTTFIEPLFTNTSRPVGRKRAISCLLQAGNAG